MSERPNVLLLVVDCLRADRAVEAGRTAVTPNLDRLAAQGTVFTHAITVNSYTVPCVVSLLTGMYPKNHGVRDMAHSRIPANVSTLAERFKAAGYRTYAELCGPLSPTLGFNRGYDECRMRSAIRDYLDGDWGEALRTRLTSGRFQPPWFLHIHLWELHQPRRVPKEFDSPKYGAKAYDRALSAFDVQLGRLLQALPPNTAVVLTGDHGERLTQSKSDEIVQHYKVPVQRFLKRMGIKRRTQRQVTSMRQDVLRAFRRWGLVKDPLSTLVGHGFHVYDYLVRVPLIVSAPNAPRAGRRVAQQVRQVDLLPTLVEMFDLDADRLEGLDGRSLTPALRGRTLSPLAAFIETTSSGLGNGKARPVLCGVRTDEWKYAFSPRGASIPEELYHLPSDPEEKNNVAASRPGERLALRLLGDEFFGSPPSVGPRAPSSELNPHEVDELKHRLRELGYME